MTARCPGPVTANQAQIISPPPPCLTVSMRCSCWYAVVGFLQTCCGALWPNISTLGLFVQKKLFQKCFVQMQLYKPKLCCHVLFRAKRFSPATLPNKPYLFSLFLTVLSWTLTFNMITEACRVWDVALGVFLHFLWALHNLTLGWTCWDVQDRQSSLNVSHLWIIFLSMMDSK